MQLLLLIPMLLFAQTAVYLVLLHPQKTLESEKWLLTSQSPLRVLREGLPTTIRKIWSSKQLSPKPSLEIANPIPSASLWHLHRPYKKRPENKKGVDLESSTPLIAVQDSSFGRNASEGKRSRRGASAVVTAQVTYDGPLVPESTELIQNFDVDMNRGIPSLDITISMLPRPRRGDELPRAHDPQPYLVNPRLVMANMLDNREEEFSLPPFLQADYNEIFTATPLSSASTWDILSPSQSVEAPAEHADLARETPFLLDSIEMTASEKPNSTAYSSAGSPGAYLAQRISESPEPVVFTESEVASTAAPDPGMGKPVYPTLALDHTETLAFDSNLSIHPNLCIYSDCSNEFQKIVILDTEVAMGRDDKEEEDHGPHRGRKIGSSRMASNVQHRQSVLVLQFCVWSPHNISLGDYNVTERTTVYAFESDPRGINPKVMAASNTDPKGGIQFRCEESLRLELPLLVPRTFIMLSRPRSLHHALVNISSSLSSFALLKSGVTFWNSEILAKAQNFLNNKEPSANALSRVYIISSLPYLQHSELDGVMFDTNGVAAITAALRGTKISDHYCDPTGSEIAAAVAGRTIGMRHYVNLRVVPVPIRSCRGPATEGSVLRALLWVYDEMLRRSEGKTIIITEQFTKGLLTSKAVSKVLSQLGKGGALTFIPTKDCPRRISPFISIGAYGLLGPNLYEVGFEPKSCAGSIDVFAPGVNVGGISTIGPWAYRNISNAPHIAAASIASLFLSLLPHLRQDFDAQDLRQTIKNSRNFPPSIVLYNHVATTSLPLVHVQTLPMLLNAILREYGGSTDVQENKAASSLIPNFPNSALIGVCAVAGALIVAMLVGAIFAIKRDSVNDSDFSYIIAEPSTRDGDGEDGRGRLEQQASCSNSQPAEVVATRPRPDCAVVERLVDATTSSPVRRNRSNHNPLVEIGRLLSITKSMASPETPNAKASWFSTPKDPANECFNEKASPSCETSSECSCVPAREENLPQTSLQLHCETLSIEAEKLNES